jgi:hypothetical protein
MLKFRMKLKLNDGVQAKCKKHPKYNPEKEGSNIKGGCSTCLQLWDLYRSKLELERAVRIFQRNAAPWIKYRAPRMNSGSAAAPMTELEANYALE